jgi:hypothetical protein
VRATVVVGALAVLMALMPAAPASAGVVPHAGIAAASAVALSGSGYDGKDPVATGCVNTVVSRARGYIMERRGLRAR